MGCALGREHVVSWSKSDVEELRTVSKTRSSAGTVRSFDTKFGEERVRWELSMQNLEQWSSTVHVDLGAAEMEKLDQEAVRAPNFDTAKPLPMTLSDLEQQEHHGVLSKEHRQMCLMCWERLSVISLSPCGHLCLCSECTVQRSVQSAASMIRFKCPIPGCGQRVCAVHKMLTASQESLRIARERYRHRQQVQRRVIQRWNHKSVVLCCQAWAEHVAADKEKQRRIKGLQRRLVRTASTKGLNRWRQYVSDIQTSRAVEASRKEKLRQEQEAERLFRAHHAMVEREAVEADLEHSRRIIQVRQLNLEKRAKEIFVTELASKHKKEQDELQELITARDAMLKESERREEQQRLQALAEKADKLEMPVLSPRHVAITATASFAACAVALWTQPVRKEGANTETDSSCNSSAEENEDSWAESHAKDNEQDHRRDAVGRVLLHDGLARMQRGGSMRGGGSPDGRTPTPWIQLPCEHGLQMLRQRMVKAGRRRWDRPGSALKDWRVLRGVFHAWIDLVLRPRLFASQAQQVQNTRQVQDMVTSLDSLDPASAKVPTVNERGR